MNAFTDEDLKRFKEVLESPYYDTEDFFPFKRTHLCDLIARLEAAENVVVDWQEDNSECNSFCGYHCRNIVAWRKAAGKDR